MIPEERGRLGYVVEPASGMGHMAEVIREYTEHVYSTDLYEYGYGEHAGLNFLDPAYDEVVNPADWYITNPPFNRSLEFALRALSVCRIGMAMLCRTQWLESRERYHRLFLPTPPTIVAPFVERVPMTKGHWDPDASTTMAYCWFVWKKGETPRAPIWIPPDQRELLTKETDLIRFAWRQAAVETTVDDFFEQEYSYEE